MSGLRWHLPSLSERPLEQCLLPLLAEPSNFSFISSFFSSFFRKSHPAQLSSAALLQQRGVAQLSLVAPCGAEPYHVVRFRAFSFVHAGTRYHANIKKICTSHPAQLSSAAQRYCSSGAQRSAVWCPRGAVPFPAVWCSAVLSFAHTRYHFAKYEQGALGICKSPVCTTVSDHPFRPVFHRDRA